MHVALVGGIFHLSPSERSARQPTTETILAAELRKRGHDVTELSPRDFRKSASLANHGVELIHVHHPGRLTTRYAVLPHRLPVIYTPHRTNLPRKRVLRLGHLRLLRGAQQVVALSPAEQELLISERGVARERIAVIPNGFPGEYLRPRRREPIQAGGRWTLLFVGQLIPEKQPLAIIDAIDDSRLRDFVHVRYVFHNDQLKHELEEEIRRRGLCSTVSLIGQLHGEQLAQEYYRAHLLLLPSRSLEALPTVIIEAVLTGLPVIAGDVGGTRWELDGFGRCIADIDAEKLRSALLSCIANYRDLADEGPRASKGFRERFSIESMVDRHEILYQKVLSAAD